METAVAAGIGHNSIPARQMVTEDPSVIYRDETVLDALIEELQKGVIKDADVTSESGRKEISARALEVSRIKVSLDTAGKSLTEDWRKKTAVVNKIKARAVATLDDVRDAIRRPLDRWNDQQKQRADDIQDKLLVLDDAGRIAFGTTSAAIEARIATIEAMETTAEHFDEHHLRATIAKRAALDALRTALPVIVEQERAAAEAAELKREKAEREEAERQAERDARTREEAQRREQDRLAEIQRREQAEAARRAADLEHRSTVMRAAKEALIEYAGVSEATAKKVVTAIVAGSIPRVTLNF